jgi:hypothetical protein
MVLVKREHHKLPARIENTLLCLFGRPATRDPTVEGSEVSFFNRAEHLTLTFDRKVPQNDPTVRGHQKRRRDRKRNKRNYRQAAIKSGSLLNVASFS